MNEQKKQNGKTKNKKENPYKPISFFNPCINRMLKKYFSIKNDQNLSVTNRDTETTRNGCLVGGYVSLRFFHYFGYTL
jgi:hypothetical protein